MFTCRKRAGTTPVSYIVTPFGYMVYIQYIGGSALRALSLLSQNACGGWRARGAVTPDAMTARIGWPTACGGPRETRGLGDAFERSRAVMRGFGSGADSCV